MTHHFQEWSRRTRWNVQDTPVEWTRLVPPGWQGFCCYCGRRLTVEDWQTGRIAAAGDGNPWHCLCRCHLEVGGRERKYALLHLAHAVSGV